VNVLLLSDICSFLLPLGGTTGAAAFRTRAQRIQAIKDAASALKTRLNSEVQKMASHDLPPSATGECHPSTAHGFSRCRSFCVYNKLIIFNLLTV